jgi:hypothetical protein
VRPRGLAGGPIVKTADTKTWATPGDNSVILSSSSFGSSSHVPLYLICGVVYLSFLISPTTTPYEPTVFAVITVCSPLILTDAPYSGMS